MAFLTCNYYSGTLGMETTFQAIIPDQCKEDIPTVYLLHGLSDDYTTWVRMTSAERYARERGVALIMPNGARSFYTDMHYGYPYHTFLTEDLVNYTRQLFRLSDKREKTFIAGNSMGGYGALKSAFSRPDVYGAAAGFSAVADVAEFFRRYVSEQESHIVWGEHYPEFPNENDDLFSMAQKLSGSGQPLPRIYHACGTSDYLYDMNCRFRTFMETQKFEYRYFEDDGRHEWRFWDRYLPAALDFFLEQI